MGNNTIEITLDAYTDIIKESFRFECLKELLSKCEDIPQIGQVLEKFGINTRIGELY